MQQNVRYVFVYMLRVEKRKLVACLLVVFATERKRGDLTRT
jgi:hypothetical protein